MLQLVLGSSSVYRQNILKQMGLSFSIQKPEIDETPQPREDQKALAARLAYEKNLAIQTKISKPSIIISSDQVASFNGQALGKPKTAEKALEHLRSFQGETVFFYTSLMLYNTETQQSFEHLDVTKVNFRHQPEDILKAYIEHENPLQCAGSFKSEGLGAMLFSSLETHDPNALIGLPTIALCQGLQALGFQLPPE